MTTGSEFLANPKSRTARQAITHPDDILALPGLTATEKRAILASWASDASAVPGIPVLRQLEDGTIATIDDILRALKTLDGVPDEHRENPRPLWPATYARRRQGEWSLWPHRRRKDDDDDPPPCPAYRAIVPRRGGGGAMASPEPVLV